MGRYNIKSLPRPRGGAAAVRLPIRAMLPRALIKRSPRLFMMPLAVTARAQRACRGWRAMMTRLAWPMTARVAWAANARPPAVAAVGTKLKAKAPPGGGV